jgi:hypothetical protein
MVTSSRVSRVSRVSGVSRVSKFNRIIGSTGCSVESSVVISAVTVADSTGANNSILVKREAMVI